MRETDRQTDRQRETEGDRERQRKKSMKMACHAYWILLQFKTIISITKKKKGEKACGTRLEAQSSNTIRIMNHLKI